MKQLFCFALGMALLVPVSVCRGQSAPGQTTAPVSGFAPAAIAQPATPAPAGVQVAAPPSLPQAGQPAAAAATTFTVAGQSGPARYEEFQPLAATLTSTATSGKQMPSLILTSELPQSERSALVEDLQVLHALLSKAVGDSHVLTASADTVLGLTVSRNTASQPIEYIQDSGILYRLRVPGPSFAPKQSSGDGQTTDQQASQESEWERTRRELFERPPVGLFQSAGEWTSNGAAGALRYNPEEIRNLEARLKSVLANVTHIHFPMSAVGHRQLITLHLGCTTDGSAMTIRTAVTPGQDGLGTELEDITTQQYFDSSLLANTASSYWMGRTLDNAFAAPVPFLAPHAPPTPIAPSAPPANLQRR